MILELTSFSMSKLIMPYFQPLLTLPLRIGHEKHPFGYVWTLKIYGLLLHAINHDKVYHIFQFFQTSFYLKHHNP
jgi:hypothetical protein